MDIEARLEYIIFENKANHYVVAGFSELKTYHNFTAAGRIENPIEDQEYVLQGEYVKHPKYGEQFRVVFPPCSAAAVLCRSWQAATSMCVPAANAWPATPPFRALRPT